MMHDVKTNWKSLSIIGLIFLLGYNTFSYIQTIPHEFDNNDMFGAEYDAIDLNMNLNWSIQQINSGTPPTAEELYGMNLTCNLFLNNEGDYITHVMNFDGNRQMCTDLTEYYTSINY